MKLLPPIERSAAYAAQKTPDQSKNLLVLFALGAAFLCSIALAMKYGFENTPHVDDGTDTGAYIPPDYIEDSDKNFGKCPFSSNGSHWITNVRVETFTIGTLKIPTIYGECYFCGPVWRV